jgi:hypothetical protein
MQSVLGYAANRIPTRQRNSTTCQSSALLPFSGIFQFMLCAPHRKRRGILPASNIAMAHAAKESALMAAFAAYQQVAVVDTDSPDKIVDKNPSPGCCWLVGSGPGPLEHLTVRLQA